MLQVLLFCAGIAAMFAIVPLSIWAATGRLSAAWEAATGYTRVMLLLTVPGLVIGALWAAYDLIAH
jgi:Ca2+/H+ antiporter